MGEETHLAWLDNNYLASALQGEDEGQVTVIKFSVSPAVAAGTNWMSYMYRVRVEYTVNGSDQQSTSLIIKIPVTKGVMTEVVDSEYYAKEPKIYSELLPRYKKLLSYDFGPKYYSCPVTNGITLKDMKEEGYIMWDKFKQLDFSHCKLVLTTLAKFHASSVACFHSDPDLIKELGKDPLFSDYDNKLLELLSKPTLKIFVKILGELEGCESAAEYILSRVDHAVDSCVDVCQPKANGFNVLNHGDLWVNNMLFKHSDSGEVEDVKLIDYSNMRWGSPATELHYFMWSSANEEVRGHKQKELYSIYCQTLNSTLEQLGCTERLSEKELDDELCAASDFALVSIGGIIPYMLFESHEAINMEDLSAKDINTSDGSENLFKGKRYRAILPKMVEQFYNWVAA